MSQNLYMPPWTSDTIYRFPAALSVADDNDVGSGYETDSDLEGEEDAGDAEVAETSTPKSL